MIKVICPNCKFENKFKDKKEYKCKYCGKSVKAYESELDQKTEEIKSAIFINDYDLIFKLAKRIKELDANNIYGLIYSNTNFNNQLEYIKNIKEANEYNDVIFKVTVLKSRLNDEEKKEIIDNLANNRYKDYYEKILSNFPKDEFNHSEIRPDNISVALYNKKEEKNFLPIVQLIMFSITAILVVLVINLTKSECKYDLIIVFSIIPVIFASKFVNSSFKIKNIFLSIFIFLVLFIVLSYLFSLGNHECNFAQSIVNHFNRIIYAIPNILDELNNNF